MKNGVVGLKDCVKAGTAQMLPVDAEFAALWINGRGLIDG